MKNLLILLTLSLIGCASGHREVYVSSYDHAATNAVNEAKKTIAPVSNKVSRGRLMFVAPMVQGVEFDEFGKNNDSDEYAHWNATAKSGDFAEIMRSMYEKTTQRLSKQGISVVYLPDFRKNQTALSLGTRPANPVGDHKYDYNPQTYSTSNLNQLSPEDTDKILSTLPGVTSVAYVSLHSIWHRRDLVDLFTGAIEFQVNQWFKLIVCSSSTNCVTSIVPADNNRFVLTVPVPLDNGTKAEYRLKGSDYAVNLYSDQVAQVITAAIQESTQP